MYQKQTATLLDPVRMYDFSEKNLEEIEQYRSRQHACPSNFPVYECDSTSVSCRCIESCETNEQVEDRCIQNLSCPVGWSNVGEYVCAKPFLTKSVSSATNMTQYGGECEEPNLLFDPITLSCKGLCPLGYTEIDASNRCYANCPLRFQDLGTTCEMPSYERTWIKVANTDSTQRTNTQLILFFAISIVFIILFVVYKLIYRSNSEEIEFGQNSHGSIRSRSIDSFSI